MADGDTCRCGAGAAEMISQDGEDGVDGGDSEDGGCDNPPRKIPYYRLRPIRFGH
jgi:hypothetical protein